MTVSVASVLHKTVEQIRHEKIASKELSMEELSEKVKDDLFRMKIRDKHIVGIYEDSTRYNVSLDKKINIVFDKDDLAKIDYMTISDNIITLSIKK